MNCGGYSGKDDEIDMMTRSMLQIMLEFAAVVQVPESDVAQGKATPGLVETSGAGHRYESWSQTCRRRTSMLPCNSTEDGSGSPTVTSNPSTHSGS